MVRRRLFGLLAVLMLVVGCCPRAPRSRRTRRRPRLSRSRWLRLRRTDRRLGWTWAHDQGRLELEKACRTSRRPTRRACRRTPADAERVIRQFAQDGDKVIFTTSFGYMDPTINVAKDFPDTVFVHISGYKTADNVGTAFGKIEEPRYVSGWIAGQDDEDEPARLRGRLPDPGGHPRHQRLHPRRAQGQPGRDGQSRLDQHLVRPAKERAGGGSPARWRRRRDRPAPGHGRSAAGGRGARRLRRRLRRGHEPAAPKAVLTVPIWHWGVFYTDTVKKVMDGTWKPSQYWGGWKDGIVDLAPIGPMVPDDVRAAGRGRDRQLQERRPDDLHHLHRPAQGSDRRGKVADGQP